MTTTLNSQPPLQSGSGAQVDSKSDTRRGTKTIFDVWVELMKQKLWKRLAKGWRWQTVKTNEAGSPNQPKAKQIDFFALIFNLSSISFNLITNAV